MPLLFGFCPGGQKLDKSSGELLLSTDLGPIRFTKPVAYQMRDGQKENISVAYEKKAQGYGFSVGKFDPSRELIIDPLLASTYLGSTEADDGRRLAIATDGSVFLAGRSRGSDFPTTMGAYDTTFNNAPGNDDVFLSKFSADLTTLLASTYVGGGGFDDPIDVKFDSSGNLYVMGNTQSGDFPVTSGVFSTSYADCFLSKFDSNLSTLLASTFFGANSGDVPLQMHVDGSGNAYIVGLTNSSTYPVTSGAYDITHNGGADWFVSKFNVNFTSLLASTFVGGSANDLAFDVTLDSSGNVVVSG